jgi:hypothetical protein
VLQIGPPFNFRQCWTVLSRTSECKRRSVRAFSRSAGNYLSVMRLAITYVGRANFPPREWATIAQSVAGNRKALPSLIRVAARSVSRKIRRVMRRSNVGARYWAILGLWAGG